MNRCRDYLGFATWFAGIGYVVLWPLTVNGASGYPFGASVVCGNGSRGAMAIMCQLPHPFTLPVGLHLLGFLAATVVVMRLSCRLLHRLRARPIVIPVASVVARLPGTIPARPKMPVRRLRSVQPRKQFGLRGLAR